MKAKHTPGPWHIHEGGDNLSSFFVDSAKEGSVCKIAVNHHEEANARLIAAAPELLEALVQIAALAREWNANYLGGMDVQRKRWQKLGAMAESAIRKAKGE